MEAINVKLGITKKIISEVPISLDGPSRPPNDPKIFTNFSEPDKPNFQPMYARKLEDPLSNENTNNIEPPKFVQDGLSQLKTDQQVLESQTQPYSNFNPIS